MTTERDPKEYRRYGIAEARKRLGELVDQVRFTGEPIIIEKSGKAAVIMRPLTEEEKETLTREKALFKKGKATPSKEDETRTS